VRENLNAHTIANTVRMTRSQHDGSFILVEGDSDIRVYRRFVNQQECLLILAHNKDNAIGALAILEEDNFTGILSIVDSDCWNLETAYPSSPNLFLTDTHDLETMILATSEVQEKIFSEFGSDNRIKTLRKSPIDMILEAVLPIGYLRWFSSPSQDNLRVEFKKLMDFGKLEDFIDKNTLITNLNTLIPKALECSANKELKEETVKKKIKSSLKAGHDPWQLCSGHDLLFVLTFGLCFVFGNKKAKTLSPEHVEGMIRMSYEYAYFCKTRLYQSIKNWETTHSSFLVLK